MLRADSNQLSPYIDKGEQFTPERGTRTGSGNLNAHTRAATDVSGSDKKGVASPPPAFPAKTMGPRQTCMERHTDMARWNSAKELAKSLSELRVAQIESEELKRQYDKLRKEKLEAERESKELKRDNKEMSGKIVEQVEWIQGQMERNHGLSVLLKSAKTFLETYSKKLWVANQEFKELSKYILAEKNALESSGSHQCNCAANYCSSLDRIGAKLGVLIKSAEEVSEQSPQSYIDKLIQELNKEVVIRPNRKRAAGLIAKPNQDPFKEMRMKIEELKDEVQFGSKWKSMYMELLTDKSVPLPLPPEEYENEQVLEKELAAMKDKMESEKTAAVRSLKREIEDLKEEATKSKTIAHTKESTVESLKRELKLAKDDAKALQEQSRQARELKEQEKLLVEQINSLTEQNTSLKEQTAALRDQLKSLKQETKLNEARGNDDYLRAKAENGALRLRVAELETGTGSLTQADVDAAVSQLSAVVLKGHAGGALGEKEAATIQKLFGPNAVEVLQKHKEGGSQYKEDCKAMLSLLNDLVVLGLRE